MFRYAVTIFLSAFLLFQVQPLIGKFILPWFGGTPAVWTTCMLFFQAALLTGYTYAHLLTSKCTPRQQMLTHLGLLVVSLAFLPIAPSAEWKPSGDELPAGRILALLAASIGLPYFLLSTTGPLMQEAYRRETGHPPYRLYALSNVGSLLALLSYPFLFEPFLPLALQVHVWTVGYIVFAMFCGWCSLGFIKEPHPDQVVPEQISRLATGAVAAAPRRGDIALWLALAACGSAMLLSTTNQLCQEVSAVPFLWVLPLSLYLTTFIICFDHERWYRRDVFLVLLVLVVLGACYAIYRGTHLAMWKQVSIYLATLWACCMVCHGELVRHKPAPRYATLFYLMVSAGGVVGGILVAIVAPLVLGNFWEYEISLVATIVLAFFATVQPSADQPATRSTSRWLLGGAISIVLGLGLGAFVGDIIRPTPDDQTYNLETARNFYGVLHVNRETNPHDESFSINELINGRIQHGFQYIDPAKRAWVTTYYGKESGVGIAIEHHPRRASGTLRIGVIGLGAGTLAAYARAGDSVRFYEINPVVLRVSDEYFTYRKDAIERGASVELVLGDARIKMEREVAQQQSQQFDILAVDAFTSDAIPMHLLTTECGRVFFQHLKPDGILCMHVSNRFLNLHPVVRGMATSLGYEAILVESSGAGEVGQSRSTWVLVTKNQDFLRSPALDEVTSTWNEALDTPIVWTDDFSSLLQVLDWGIDLGPKD